MSLAFALTGASLSFAPAVVPVPTSVRAATPTMDIAKDFFSDFAIDTTPVKPWKSTEISNKAGLEKLANELNPIFGYYDPLNIGDKSKETIGWFRHAEIKHGRVAMAAFVGFCRAVRATSGDALPSAAKLQIFAAIGFLELCGESSIFLAADGQQHYVRGGKPGYFPKLKGKMPHPIPLNLWDPLGLTAKMTPERKARALLAEINNGRLAQLGIFGLVSASKGLIVPGLDSLPLIPYKGEFMAPFSAIDAGLPFVQQMLDARAAQVLREAAFLGQH
ncbi:chloroplast light harvesting protein isoform 12 [Chrysochromulina tobinii]|uniref:Chloroplast light harvesting protein isoform 12 n=1 Tax=Chrysochromulina tobinii TaxID=1460289 RepID=A0A0M0K786_9EUKA|nr:chloroplast light harvesting protein isoform 12 [Chrysochromulina tobinii]|eukprot:KOO34258.1 chloroplast light harvesting protein isoform 12 [Chrysochromulina sp. CCMP291]